MDRLKKPHFNNMKGLKMTTCRCMYLYYLVKTMKRTEWMNIVLFMKSWTPKPESPDCAN